MAIDEGYSVRQLEEWVREDSGRHGDATFDAQIKEDPQPATRAPRTPTPARSNGGCPTRSGLAVSIDDKGGKGTLHIKYKDLDQLDAVLRKLEG